MIQYIRQWFRDLFNVFAHELRQIFTDGGVMIIFFVAGFGYPVIYNFIYRNGVLNDTPVAVVDDSGCAVSRRYIRELDATREVSVAARCATMTEAKDLFQKRKVNGIVYFPSDFGDKIERMETSKISIYADMSSFLYYKNLLMGANFVMLDEIGQIQIERYAEAGYTDAESMQLVKPIPYEENNPYNRTFSYSIFLLSAVLLIIVQQTMFYGMCLLSGTARERNRSIASLPSTMEGAGVGRVVLGRGFAYWLVYWGIAIYIACIIPGLFGLPQRGSFKDIVTLLFFFLTASVFFCQCWSSFITRRETVFVLLLVISPVILFLTGCTWPTSAFPKFWKLFSYLFPSTFACQAFTNMNTAGGDLSAASSQIVALTAQAAVYYLLSCVCVFAENRIIANRDAIRQKKNAIESRIGLDRRKDVLLIAGEESLERNNASKGIQ